MRKFYTFMLIPVFLFTVVQVHAQSCDPDQSLPDSVIVDPQPYQEQFPDRGIADTACVGSYFETVLQFQLPDSVLIQGTPVPIQGASIEEENAINNLPAGFNYSCNPPTCDFAPDSVGCIIVYGTAEVGAEEVYDLTIDVIIDIGFPIARTLPDPLLAPGNYFLHVRGPDGPNCAVVSTVDYLSDAGFQMTIAPNPTANRAVLEVNLSQRGSYQLGIYDLVGRQVLQRSLELDSGENQINIDATNLPAGMYVFTLDDGQKGASGRLVVQK